MEESTPFGMPELARQISYSPEKFQSKVIFELDKQKAILFAFSRGQQLKEHKTSHDVLLVALEGECDFSMDDVVQRLRAGQVYRIPADVPHALEAVTDFKMLLIK
ncbi:cupin domain-containing protein [Pontibacter ruber]|uniref:Cupin domain-containing protein n=1 Tax=Pontibacter ruber TaxID=1343895 RepID=A0ABW5D5T0_9BACT|nr:cupin domain-containing protein [Pontibacter ruber]